MQRITIVMFYNSQLVTSKKSYVNDFAIDSQYVDHLRVVVVFLMTLFVGPSRCNIYDDFEIDSLNQGKVTSESRGDFILTSPEVTSQSNS